MSESSEIGTGCRSESSGIRFSHSADCVASGRSIVQKPCGTPVSGSIGQSSAVRGDPNNRCQQITPGVAESPDRGCGVKCGGRCKLPVWSIPEGASSDVKLSRAGLAAYDAHSRHGNSPGGFDHLTTSKSTTYLVVRVGVPFQFRDFSVCRKRESDGELS